MGSIGDSSEERISIGPYVAKDNIYFDHSMWQARKFCAKRKTIRLIWMTLDEFNQSIAKGTVPANLTPVLQGLWHDAKGNWEKAHEIAQEHEGTREFDRLHAYLHRKEGDAGNAGYWYRRAGSKVFSGSLEDEWRALVLANRITT